MAVTLANDQPPAPSPPPPPSPLPLTVAPRPAAAAAAAPSPGVAGVPALKDRVSPAGVAAVALAALLPSSSPAAPALAPAVSARVVGLAPEGSDADADGDCGAGRESGSPPGVGPCKERVENNKGWVGAKTRRGKHATVGARP